jgi:hypothetical protein
MKINHPITNITEIARRMDVTQSCLVSKMKRKDNKPFTDEDIEKLESIFKDYFCYIFEVDEIEIIDNKLIGKIII